MFVLFIAKLASKSLCAVNFGLLCLPFTSVCSLRVSYFLIHFYAYEYLIKESSVFCAQIALHSFPK